MTWEIFRDSKTPIPNPQGIAQYARSLSPPLSKLWPDRSKISGRCPSSWYWRYLAATLLWTANPAPQGVMHPLKSSFPQQSLSSSLWTSKPVAILQALQSDLVILTWPLNAPMFGRSSMIRPSWRMKSGARMLSSSTNKSQSLLFCEIAHKRACVNPCFVSRT